MSGLSARGRKTKQKMMQVALDLFHSQGVRATSPQEIMDKTGTGKSQFYHYFGSKEGLVHEILQHIYGQVSEGGFNGEPINTWKDLEGWFQFFIDAQKHFNCQRGCPIATIGSELDADQELIRQDVNAIFSKMMTNVTRFFDRLKAQKRLNSSADPDELARFCFSTVQGGLLVSRIQQNSQPLEAAVKHAISHLKSLKN